MSRFAELPFGSRPGIARKEVFLLLNQAFLCLDKASLGNHDSVLLRMGISGLVREQKKGHRMVGWD
jgi:hypothetical protein